MLIDAPEKTPSTARGSVTRDPADERRAESAEEDDRYGQQVQFHTLLSQSRKESGSELQAHRKDEKNQPKLLHEIERVVIDRLAEVAGEDAREQHTGGAQADPANFDAAQRHPEDADERNQADRVRNRLGFARARSQLMNPKASRAGRAFRRRIDRR